MNINWKEINPIYKWAATDHNGDVYVFSRKPSAFRGQWVGKLDEINFYTLMVDSGGTQQDNWKSLLVKRPKGGIT